MSQSPLCQVRSYFPSTVSSHGCGSGSCYALPEDHKKASQRRSAQHHAVSRTTASCAEEKELLQWTSKLIRHRGFSTWGIQTGPFAADWADFVPKRFHFLIFILGAPISYYPRELKMRRRESPKSGWHTGVSVSGAFKLDHLQPVKMILWQKMSISLPFILGAPISYYCRERKKGNSRGWEWKNGNHPKVNDIQGFQYVEHSNWTFRSLLNWFCS